MRPAGGGGGGGGGGGASAVTYYIVFFVLPLNVTIYIKPKLTQTNEIDTRGIANDHFSIVRNSRINYKVRQIWILTSFISFAIKSSHLKMYRMYCQQIFPLIFPSSIQSTFSKHSSNPSLLSVIFNASEAVQTVWVPI